ncbi:hypothetical protein ABT173_22610, partial [Streptomyces sp. NPDC001795]|uniref:hypothetical protein n=1 Tax=Streptomyces sp. NPDC001795 TaxID=3154525 RepID=UPI00332966F1
ITVSAGDNDYGAEYPATSPYVTAVGGTSLSRVRCVGVVAEGWRPRRGRVGRSAPWWLGGSTPPLRCGVVGVGSE